MVRIFSEVRLQGREAAELLERTERTEKAVVGPWFEVPMEPSLLRNP